MRTMLSIVIPAFNEEQQIEQTITRTHELFSNILSGAFELIVVDDGSTDGTLVKLQSLIYKFRNLKIISYKQNQGKGYALRTGLLNCQGPTSAFIDADGEIEPSAIVELLRRQQTTDADVVVGSKTVLGHRPLLRKLGSWGTRQVTRALFNLPVADSQTGVKLFRTPTIQTIVRECRENGYLFDLELIALAHRAGLHVVEHEVEVRIMRESRIKAHHYVRTAKDVLSLALSVHRRTVSPELPHRTSTASHD